MKGTVYKQCWCRDAEGKKLHKKCPDLLKKGHGSWYFRYEAPRAAGERRRQPVAGPFQTKTEAEEQLAIELARISRGGAAADRNIKVGPYLEAYHAGKVNQKPRTRETDAGAFRLYWTPALGHLRVAEVRKHHVEEVFREMLKINRDEARPSETLRRMLLARADDERRVLPEGEKRHRKSTKPLSPARVARMFAPFRAAMKSAVPAYFAVSPCTGVELPRAASAEAIAWTGPREAKFRAELERRLREAAERKGKALTTVERQAEWQVPGARPSKVTVWLPSHSLAFLESIAADREYALWRLVMFCGLRRDEAAGLTWAEVDLDEGILWVRKTGSGDGPKSDAGKRAVPVPDQVLAALKAWRRQQVAERLSWGEAWTDTGLVFTHEDGTALSGQWMSRRFALLAFRAGMPPVRFHDLRHGTASLLKAAGVDTAVISAILGHSKTSFTNKVYVNVFPDVSRGAVNAAEGIVAASRGEGAR